MEVIAPRRVVATGVVAIDFPQRCRGTGKTLPLPLLCPPFDDATATDQPPPPPPHGGTLRFLARDCYVKTRTATSSSSRNILERRLKSIGQPPAAPIRPLHRLSILRESFATSIVSTGGGRGGVETEGWRWKAGHVALTLASIVPLRCGKLGKFSERPVCSNCIKIITVSYLECLNDFKRDDTENSQRMSKGPSDVRLSMLVQHCLNFDRLHVQHDRRV